MVDVVLKLNMDRMRRRSRICKSLERWLEKKKRGAKENQDCEQGQRRQYGLKSGGSWIRVKNRFFQANFRKISIFVPAISLNNFDFWRQISEKFRFFKQFD